MTPEAIGWGFAFLLYMVGVDLCRQYILVVDRRDEYLPITPLQVWLSALAWFLVIPGVRLWMQWDRMRGKS